MTACFENAQASDRICGCQAPTRTASATRPREHFARSLQNRDRDFELARAIFDQLLPRADCVSSRRVFGPDAHAWLAMDVMAFPIPVKL